MFDVIGDIHGYADKLIALLQKLGYQVNGAMWEHPEGRKLVFAGDYLDRGPQILEVLRIVRACVTQGTAYAVIGNHEFNALAYECLRSDDADPSLAESWCRKHSKKNQRQYAQTVEQLATDDHADWMQWLRGLPLVWETDGLRVVHACWDQDAIDFIQAQLARHVNQWTDALIRQASDSQTDLYTAVELVLKGLEIELPAGKSYHDKEGTLRHKARVQWWRQPHADEALGQWLMPPQADLNHAVGAIEQAQLSIPDAAAPITCIGHYWMPPYDHQPIHDKIVCVDYSVAIGGDLCAYRFNGEDTATASHLVYV